MSLNALVKLADANETRGEAEVVQRGDVTVRDQDWWVEWRGRTEEVPTNVFRHTRQTFRANESKERAKNSLRGNA